MKTTTLQIPVGPPAQRSLSARVASSAIQKKPTVVVSTTTNTLASPPAKANSLAPPAVKLN